jgi:hypothetical protein
MKNAANAFAPAAVCWAASSGMIGSFSPGLVFGPVVGTSAGSVGVGGFGGPANDDDGGGSIEIEAVRPIGALDVGAAPPDEDVQAADNSAANAAIVQISRTSSSCPRSSRFSTATAKSCG